MTTARIRALMETAAAAETRPPREVEHGIEAGRLEAVAALNKHDLPAPVIAVLHNMIHAVTRHNA
ncbi:hypothetical protein RKD37_000312 [Streptomyces ambofaciens]